MVAKFLSFSMLTMATQCKDLTPLHVVTCLTCRRELSTWWFHLHRALSVVGLVLAIAGAATGGGLVADDYHEAGGGSAHKALGGLTVAAAAIQVRDITCNTS